MIPTSATAQIRVRPEDFLVEEEAAYAPSGEGDHTFLWIQKRLESTDDIARTLARIVGVRPGDVGYAGRKDRVAVTRQWFSVPGIDPERALALELPGARVLFASRHRHKLRTGHLRGNRFEIRVSNVDAVLRAAANPKAQRLLEIGMPNRYGGQRFGRDGNNADRALAILRGELRPRDRRKGRFLLSALQSAVFNEVLAARPLGLDQVEVGDVARVDASGGLFEVEDLAREAPRARAFEISATGPIFGAKERLPSGAPLAREVEAMTRCEIPPPGDWKLPRGLRLPGARRPFRVRPVGLALKPDGSDASSLVVHCSLPPGTYVTVLLQELFGELEEASADGVAARRVS